MNRRCSETVFESATRFRARDEKLVSFCKFGMFFDDALDGLEVKLLNGIVRKATVETGMESQGAKRRWESEVWVGGEETGRHILMLEKIIENRC